MELPDGVEELSIWQSSLLSLKGISRYRNLKKVSLAPARRLTDVDELNQLPQLEFFQTAYAPKIEYSTLNNLTLKTLLIEAGSIPSFKFLNNLPSLQQINTNAKALDGDLTPITSRKWHPNSYVKRVKLTYF
jgi:hypothetical protein